MKTSHRFYKSINVFVSVCQTAQNTQKTFEPQTSRTKSISTHSLKTKTQFWQCVHCFNKLSACCIFVKTKSLEKGYHSFFCPFHTNLECTQRKLMLVTIGNPSCEFLFDKSNPGFHRMPAAQHVHIRTQVMVEFLSSIRWLP